MRRFAYPVLLGLLFVSAMAQPALAGERQLHVTGVVVLQGNPTTGPAPFTASGKGTHVGRWTGGGTVTITVDEAVVSAGTFTIVAANGDSLTFAFSATGTTTNRTGPVTFVSGTGRFEDAELDATITSTTVDGVVNVSIDGTIDY